MQFVKHPFLKFTAGLSEFCLTLGPVLQLFLPDLAKKEFYIQQVTPPVIADGFVNCAFLCWVINIYYMKLHHKFMVSC